MNRSPHTILLPRTRSALTTTGFADTLRQELAGLPPGSLPLQQALRVSSHAIEDAIDTVVLSVDAQSQTVQVRIGVFYTGIVAGCNCADDPSTVEPQPEYCELLLAIDRTSGAASVTLLDS